MTPQWLLVTFLVVGAFALLWWQRRESYGPGMLVLRLHNEPPGTTTFRLGINGLIVSARRTPTPHGTTYRVPVKKYQPVKNISVQILGNHMTVERMELEGKNILSRVVYTGTDLQVVGDTTQVKDADALNATAKRKVCRKGKWDRAGLYVYLPGNAPC